MMCASLLLFHGLVFAAASGEPTVRTAVFPGKEWERKKPAEVDLDKAQLKRLAEAMGGRGCVIRNGYLAYSWGDIEKPGDIASAAKPVYAHFLWKALADEKIPSLDEEVSKYEPRLKDLNKDRGFKDRAITWRQLATQTSCYGVSEEPGKGFDYSDQQMALFWDLLFTKVYGATPTTADEKVLKPGLIGPLSFQDKATMLAFGAKDRAGRLAISPRDFARFGLLYLNEGKWNGKQLLPAEMARRAVNSPLPASLPRTNNKKAEMLPTQRSIGGGNNQTDHFGQYSFLWWGNFRGGKDRLWPDLPDGCYAALGHGGKRGLLVIPAHDLIVSWNDARIENRQMQNECFVWIVRSVVGQK